MSMVEAPKGTTREQGSVVRKYPQKFLLQRRNSQGFLIKVETFPQPVSPEEILVEFGPGYYVLKSTKPRFQTVWKGRLGDSENSEPLDRIEKTTRNLKYGLVAVGTGELVGFGLTHLRFLTAEKRIDGIEAVLRYSQPFKPESMQCGICGKPLVLLFQKHCGSCGTEVDWTSISLLTKFADATLECLSCRKPLLRGQAYCIHCGFQQPTPISSTSTNLAEAGYRRRTVTN